MRKRPINQKEVKKKDWDSVSAVNPIVVVHKCMLRVDGITKYLENNDFQFDHSFGEESSNDDVYRATCEPLVRFIFQGGKATCFAYGQVIKLISGGGGGKTVSRSFHLLYARGYN